MNDQDDDLPVKVKVLVVAFATMWFVALVSDILWMVFVFMIFIPGIFSLVVIVIFATELVETYLQRKSNEKDDRDPH